MNSSLKQFLSTVIYWSIVIISIVILWGVQHLLSMPSSKILFAIKIVIAFFFADCLNARWVRPRLLQKCCDEYPYNSYLIKKIKNLNSIKPWHIFLLGLLFDVIVSGALYIGNDPSVDPMHGKTILSVFLVGLIISPLLETLIFQCLVIESINQITTKASGYTYTIFAGFISAVLFGSLHVYSIKYIIITAFIGLYLSFVYIFFSTRYNSWVKGCVATAFMHFLMNLLPFVQMVLFKD